VTLNYKQSIKGGIMKRMFKQSWSTISSISTKRTIIYYLRPLKTKHTIIYGKEIQVLPWDRHTIVAGLNWLIGSKPSSDI